MHIYSLYRPMKKKLKVIDGSGLCSGGLTWSIVLNCDDHRGIFTCDGCARDRTFMSPPRHRAM